MPTESEKVRDDGQAPDPKQDGARPIHVHNYGMPPQDMLNQSVRQAVRAAETDRPRRRRRERQPRGRAGFFLAKLLRIGWEVVGLAFLGLLNVMVLSGGLIELSPSLFGAKMSTMPGFGWMAGYLVWNKVLVGHVIALGFFCVMAFCWKIVIKDLLLRHGVEEIDPDKWDVQRARVFWRSACAILMLCDALLFYYGVTQSNLWLKQSHPFTALVSTLMYLAIVAVYSFGSLYVSDWERSE